MRRTKLGTGDTITIDGDRFGVLYTGITLDVNKQRVYWLKNDLDNPLTSIISSDYNGKDVKSIRTDQNLMTGILGVSDNSIFVMNRETKCILMMNGTDGNLSRKITIKNSNYYDLIVFNNKFNHTTGE